MTEIFQSEIYQAAKRLWLPLVMLLMSLNATKSRGDDLLSSGKFFQQLSSPLNLVLEGQPFRESLMHVAEQGDINVWIDRQVDPTQPVNPGKLGPNVFGALKTIASQRDCVVMPTANVVLVGRPAWVDATAAAIISCPASTAVATVQWDAMTTPTDAFAAAAGDRRPGKLRLPHDLWPATKLRAVNRTIAANLVLSQFGRHLSSTKTLDPMSSVSNKNDKPVTRTYTADETTKDAFATAQGQVKFKAVGTKLFVTALPKSHRIATGRLFTANIPANANQNAKMGANDTRQFSLKLINKPAALAIKSFAQTVNAKCVVTPRATQAAEKLVSLDANNKTIAELIDMTAGQVGLKAVWTGGTVTIDLPD